MRIDLWLRAVLSVLLVANLRFTKGEGDGEGGDDDGKDGGWKTVQADFVNDLEEDVKVLWVDPEREDENDREVLKENFMQGDRFLVEAVESDTFEFVSRMTGKLLHKRVLLHHHDTKELFLSGNDDRIQGDEESGSSIKIKFFNGFDEPVIVYRVDKDGNRKGSGQSFAMGLEMFFAGPVDGKFIFEGRFTGEMLQVYPIDKDDDGKYIFLEAERDDEDDEDDEDDYFDEFEEDHHHDDDDYHHHDEDEDQDILDTVFSGQDEL